MDEWDNPNSRPHDPGMPPGYPPGYTQDPRFPVRKKSKWVSGLLAFLIPGTGHLYLGLNVKGIAIMMLVAMDISAIVFAATHHLSALVIVLLSLLMPIIYFYNLFDALQSTDAVNDRRIHPGWASPVFAGNEGAAAGPADVSRGMPATGLAFLAVAGVILLLVADIGWSNWLFKSKSSMLGAIILIGAGVALWFWEMRGQRR